MPIYDKPYYDDTEPLYAPVGDYNIGIDENGLITFVPTYKASRTVLVAKPKQYINPEFIVTPTSVKPLVDDTGTPAYSVDTYNIVLEDIPLNPYQYYMESKGVAPKDVEAEHLIQRYRADQAGQRADMSRLISAMLSGGYSLVAEDSSKEWEKGNKTKAAFGFATPGMFGTNQGSLLLQLLYGAHHFLGDEGGKKTVELALGKRNDGLTGDRLFDTIISGTGDALDLALVKFGGGRTVNNILDELAKKGNTTARAIQISKAIDLSLLNKQYNIFPGLVGLAPKTNRIRDIRGIDGDVPIITEENAADIPLEEWNRQFREAEARNDIDEGQRLWNLWYSYKTPGNRIVTDTGAPKLMYHETNHEFNKFHRPGRNSDGDPLSPYGVFTKETPKDIGLGGYQMPLYVYSKNPLHVKNKQELLDMLPKDLLDDIWDVIDPLIWHEGLIDLSKLAKTRVGKFLKDNGYDGLIIDTDYAGSGLEVNSRFTDATVVPHPRFVKSSKPFTYDNGKLINLTDRANFGVNDLRYFYNQSQYPNLSLRGKVPTGKYNPLDVRIQRMMERARLKEENPKMYNLIYGDKSPFDLPQQSINILPKTTNYDIRRAMLDIDPSLTLEDLDTAAQIIMANKGGVHFNIADNSGDVVGGVSMVDIQDAVNLVRKLNGREAVPYDISMIAGHEYGHGVNLPKEALDAIKGYYAPEEFYTQAGLILDNAGLIHTSTNPISFNKFMSLLDKYLDKGNLDNGISKMKEYLLSTNPMLRLKIMKNINRFSVGVLGMFGVSLLAKNNNGKVL